MNVSRYPQPLTAAQPSVEKRKAANELYKAVGSSHEVLVSATTFWPMTLFPDTITVDREKLTITHRDFFKVGEVMSMRIEDILNVTANVGPLFGSIKITTRFFDPEKPYAVNYFRRHDALKIKRIVQGYMLAIQKKVDCSALSCRELVSVLDQLGQGNTGESI